VALVEKILRTATVYVFLVASLRLAGKRAVLTALSALH
jgi:uncharacterized membrane protein YcaP (DUF421 family)